MPEIKLSGFNAAFSSSEDPESGVLRRVVGDSAIDLAKGVVGAGQTAVGLASLATGGLAGDAMDAIGYKPEETNAMLSQYYSLQRKKANQEVANADGFIDSAAAYLKNPSTIIGAGFESAPGLIGPIGISRKAFDLAVKAGLKKGLTQEAAEAAAVKAAKTGAAVGEGTMTAGSVAENIREEDPNNRLGMYAAIPAGVVTAGVGRVMGGFESAIGSRGRSVAGTSLLPRVGKGMVSEGAEEFLQSGQEQALTNVGMGKPIEEGVGKAAAGGMLTGAAMGGVFGIRGHKETAKDPVDTAIDQNSPVPALGYSPLAGTLISFPDGSVALNSEQERLKHQYDASVRAGMNPAPIVDPTAAALATAAEQKPGKAGKQETKVPDEQKDEIFAKYGDVMPNVVSTTDGRTVTAGKSFNGQKYTSNEKLEKDIAKLAAEEAAKPEPQRAAEMSYVEAFDKMMGRKPTSKEVATDLKDFSFEDVTDPTTMAAKVNVLIESLQGKKGNDALARLERLTAWKNQLDPNGTVPAPVATAEAKAQGKAESAKQAAPVQSVPETAEQKQAKVNKAVIAFNEIQEKGEGTPDQLVWLAKYHPNTDVRAGAAKMLNKTVEEAAAMPDPVERITVTDKPTGWVKSLDPEAKDKLNEQLMNAAYPDARHRNWVALYDQGMSMDKIAIRDTEMRKDEAKKAGKSQEEIDAIPATKKSTVNNYVAGKHRKARLEKAAQAIGISTEDLMHLEVHQAEMAKQDAEAKEAAKPLIDQAMPDNIDVEALQKADVIEQASGKDGDANEDGDKTKKTAGRTGSTEKFGALGDLVAKAMESNDTEALAKFAKWSQAAVIMNSRYVEANADGESSPNNPANKLYELIARWDRRIRAGETAEAATLEADLNVRADKVLAAPKAEVKTKKVRKVEKPAAEPVAKEEPKVEAKAAEEKKPRVFKKADAAVEEAKAAERKAKAEAERQAALKAKERAEAAMREEAVNAWDELAEAAELDAFDKLPRSFQARLISEYEEMGSFDQGFVDQFMEDLHNERKDGVQESRSAAPSRGYSVEQLMADLRNFFRIDTIGRTVIVVQNTDEVAHLSPDIDERTQGFVHKGKVYLIANNIARGRARAVTMHEVGSHLGLQRLLPHKLFLNLFDKIDNWAMRSDASIETQVAKRAIKRVKDAGIELYTERGMNESVAYFIEEAVLHGVNPTATNSDTAIGRFFRQLWAAFKAAVRKLGVNTDKLTAQDIVDMAYGAARLELKGAFHGTATNFRKFNHAYMGSGEGAQAYGWGSYFAQRAGVAEGYREADEDRKSTYYYVMNGKDIPSPWDANGKVKRGGLTPQQMAILEIEAGYGNGDPAAAYEALSKQYEGEEMAQRPKFKAMMEVLKDIVDGVIRYRVDIFPAVGVTKRVDFNIADDEWLMYDEPMDVGSDKVFAAYVQAAEDDLVPSGDWFDPGLTGREFYKKLSKKLGSDKAASEWLDAHGVKGLKFADYGSRGKEYGPNATYNLVVFNDKNIQRVATYKGGLGSDDIQFSKRTETVIDKLPEGVQEPVRTIVDNVVHAARKGLYYMAFTQDLADMMSKAVPSITKYMDAMKVRAAAHEHRMVEIEKFKERYEALKPNERGETGAVSKYLYDATTSGKWGFKPSWVEDAVVDRTMELRHKALSPQAQKLVEDIFKHGHDSRVETQKLMNAEINTEFDARVAAAKGDATEIAKIEKERTAALRTYGAVLAELKGPYAPLKRYGDYVAVATSPELRAAEDAEDWKKVSELRQDPNHYQVYFTDTLGEANARARDIKAKYPNMVTRTSEKIAALESLHGGPERLEVFRKLRKLATEEFGEDGKASRALSNMISDLYLATLAESNARKSDLRREGIEGADRDMLRNFYTQGRANATFIAGLQQNGKVTDAITEMIKQAKNSDDPGKNTAMVNEVLKRHVQGMQPVSTPVQDRIAAGTSAWMLLTSPATILTNGMQTLMVTVPQLAARYGYTTSIGQTKRAYYETGAMMKGTGVFQRLNIDAAPKDVKGMLQKLLENGRIDITLDQEISRIIKNGDSNIADRALAKLRAVTQKVEMINRVTAAMAAYRLALANGKTDAEAVQYADDIVYQTHGDYNGFNASRAFRIPMAKVLLQFKKYQMFQIGLLARNFNEVFTNDKGERAIAAKALAWSMSHYAVMGGALGLPGMNILGPLLAALLGGDDEPNDEEVVLRRLIDNKELADLLLYGAPGAAGMKSISERLGGRNTTSILPFTDVDLSSRSGYEKMLTALSGPFFGGLLPRAVSGIHDVMGGNYYDGMTKLAPTGVANVMKAVKQSNEGFMNARGDTLIQPEDISMLSTLGQAIGLPTDTIKDAQFLEKFRHEYETHYRQEQKALTDKYTRAAKEGDQDAMADVREKYMAMQQSMRDNGFKPTPLSTLLKSPMAQAKRERNTIGGVEYSKMNRQFLQDMSER